MRGRGQTKALITGVGAAGVERSGGGARRRWRGAPNSEAGDRLPEWAEHRPRVGGRGAVALSVLA
jgi:hypothetical protein